MSAHIIAGSGDFTIKREGEAVTVSIRADKIPNRHGYGHTVESGTITRTYARMMARKYVTPAQHSTVDVSGCIGSYHVGTDLWRTYTVTGVQS